MSSTTFAIGGIDSSDDEDAIQLEPLSTDHNGHGDHSSTSTTTTSTTRKNRNTNLGKGPRDDDQLLLLEDDSDEGDLDLDPAFDSKGKSRRATDSTDIESGPTSSSTSASPITGTNNKNVSKKEMEAKKLLEATSFREPDGSIYIPPKSGVHMRRILALAKPEIWLLLAGLVSLVIASGSALFLPSYAGQIIDAVAKGGTHELNKALLSLGIVFGISALFTFFRAALFNISGERVVARLRKKLFQAIIEQEVAFFDVNKTGTIDTVYIFLNVVFFEPGNLG
jgi:hypothetical protein